MIGLRGTGRAQKKLPAPDSEPRVIEVIARRFELEPDVEVRRRSRGLVVRSEDGPHAWNQSIPSEEGGPRASLAMKRSRLSRGGRAGELILC